MPRTKKPITALPVKIRAILIDPFKGALIEQAVNHDGTGWPALLDYARLSYLRIPFGMVWLDLDGFRRSPDAYPTFKLRDFHPQPLAGFALLTGPPLHEHLIDCPCSIEELGKQVEFEQWTLRLNPDDYIEQLLRIYPISRFP